MISISQRVMRDLRRHDPHLHADDAVDELLRRLHRVTVGDNVREFLRLICDERGALNPKTAVARRNAALDAAFDTVLNSGSLRIYDGTQPTDADTALGSQVLGAQLTLNSTAFAAASSGSKSANAITADSSADASITATWASLVTSGATRLMDMSAGTSSVNLTLNSAAISSGANVSCSSLSVTQAA